MGADMHAYIEVKERLSTEQAVPNEWSVEAEWLITRDYILFGFLAGVRKEELKLIEPKGLPLDVSRDVHEILAEDMESLNVHTCTWFTKQELNDVSKAYSKLTGIRNSQLLAIYGALKGYEASGVEARLVAWFDD